MACRLKDFALSKEQSLELLLEEWNERCEPAWPVDELETKKRQDLYGVEWDEGADNALSRMGEPLIKNLLDRFAMSVVCGQSNSGKTFMALDFAYHVAAGIPWFGDRKVKQGLVVYVAAEGGRAVFKRTAALKKTHALANVPLVVMPCPINLLQTEKQSDTQKIIDLVRGYEAEFGLKCELLVVDTNASTDMGNFIRQVDRIRAELQTHVLVVHHAGKDIARGSRGWSGIQAATDTEIEIHENKLTVTKQRDIDPMRSIGFRLRSVAIGQDADGEAVTSCVVNYCGAPEFNVDLAPAEKKAANVVKALASEKATEGDMTITLTFAEIHVHYEAVNGAISKSNLSNKLSSLIHKGCSKKRSRVGTLSTIHNGREHSQGNAAYLFTVHTHSMRVGVGESLTM